MSHRRPAATATWMALALIATLASAALAQTNPPLPTMADLHDLYAKKSYRVCLQQIFRVTNLRPDLAKAYDRGDCLLLRAYCFLGQRDGGSALIAFKAAEKAATTGAQKVQAHAMRVLLTACPTLVYQPMDRSAPLDILDETQRKKAMIGLCLDRFDPVAREISRVQNATTLPPMQAVVPRLLDLVALEKAGTGSLERTLPIGRALGDRIREIINKELATVSARDSNIRQISSAVIWDGSGQTIGPDGSKWYGGVERRGLSTDDRTTLRNDIDYLSRIQDTVEDAADLARMYTGNSDRWTDIVARAAQAVDLATSTLNSE
jgi:hypothetical protein